MKEYVVAVVGALGAVGQEMIKALEERHFPVKRLVPMHHATEDGDKYVTFRGEPVKVELSEPASFEGVDFALFAVSNAVSKQLAPQAVEKGAIVIDNSSAFRMDENVPLVVPEINPGALKGHHGIIANPNCTTVIALMPIKPLHDYAKVKRIIASSYQAVSGAGARGLTELHDQTLQVLNGEPVKPEVFQYQIAFNVIPHIDYFEENGYSHEEMKMYYEGRKILGLDDLMVNCTCVRVPVYRSHSISITIETEKPLSPAKARELLSQAEGVKLFDDPAKLEYPMPLDTSDQDLVWVGRIREDISSTGNGLSFWCCGDQLRKGAAVNAVQIAEKMIEMDLI